MKLGLNFRKALVFETKLTRDEYILQTINNSTCSSLSSLWEKFELNKEITSIYKTKSILKRNLFDEWQEKKWLIRGRAFDIPEYKKSGYLVNVSEAFKDRLPYTITFLNPLPIVYRHDYIFHLLIKDRSLPYKIFPEEYHSEIDKLNLELNDLINRNSISLIEIHKTLVREMSNDPKLNNLIEEKNSFTPPENKSIKRKVSDFLRIQKPENPEIKASQKISEIFGLLNTNKLKEIPLN